jgi:hypothetical protein
MELQPFRNSSGSMQGGFAVAATLAQLRIFVYSARFMLENSALVEFGGARGSHGKSAE